MSLILRYLRLHRGSFLLGLAALIVTNGLTLVIPWLLKDAVEALRASAPKATIARLALAICAIAAVLSVIRTWSRWLILGTSRRVVSEIRDSLYARLLSLPASFYARNRTGDLMSRAVNDLRLIRSLFGPGILQLLNVSLLYSAGLVLMIAIDPMLTLAAILTYPVLMFAVARVSRTIHHRSNLAQEQLATISNRAQENLSGINLIKAYVREDAEIGTFTVLSREYRRRSLALARSRGLIVSLMGALGGLSTIIVLWLGGLHVVGGRLSLGGFIAFNSYLALLTGPTIMMGWMIGVFQRGLGAIRRIEEIERERSDLPGDALAPRGIPLRGAVSARNLRFRYPDGSIDALRDLSFEVPAGATIGVVGRVGSGKSTLGRLLTATFPVLPGTLFLDGRDINTIPTVELRAAVGIVPQETFLFSRSLADNIALGRPGAGRDRIDAAARLARLDPDLARFPHGLDTLVGERGITLSGGQRQRVALARALILDPRVLILDDALSSVDADTEREILSGLRDFMGGRTSVIVSHRVSTVLMADTILVLDEGSVLEAGPPARLLAGDGPFARMHRQQQIESELEAL